MIERACIHPPPRDERKTDPAPPPRHVKTEREIRDRLKRLVARREAVLVPRSSLACAAGADIARQDLLVELGAAIAALQWVLGEDSPR